MADPFKSFSPGKRIKNKVNILWFCYKVKSMFYFLSKKMELQKWTDITTENVLIMKKLMSNSFDYYFIKKHTY